MRLYNLAIQLITDMNRDIDMKHKKSHTAVYYTSVRTRSVHVSILSVHMYQSVHVRILNISLEFCLEAAKGLMPRQWQNVLTTTWRFRSTENGTRKLWMKNYVMCILLSDYRPSSILLSLLSAFCKLHSPCLILPGYYTVL